jgi:ribonuclease BN (tRNA processing enzyme)
MFKGQNSESEYMQVHLVADEHGRLAHCTALHMLLTHISGRLSKKHVEQKQPSQNSVVQALIMYSSNVSKEKKLKKKNK